MYMHVQYPSDTRYKAKRVNAFRVFSIRLAFESKRVYSQLAVSETCTSLRVVSRGHALTSLARAVCMR